MANQNPQSVWTYDLLWAKSLMYMQRALAAPRDSDLFPFWASLSLEFVARASLAQVSPVLLADTSEADGRHLLHALGIEPKVKAYVPKSVQTSDVLTRCEQLVPSFTKEIEVFCRGFVNKRNEELHSGGTPFSSLSTHSWLPRFYEACSVLLQHQKKTLSDFVGPEEAKAAEVMLTAVADEAAKSVQKQINAFSEVWKAKKDDERTAQQLIAKNLARPHLGHVVQCPSCLSPALVTGEDIKQQPPSLEDEVLVVRTAVLPTDFGCDACGLKIKGHSQLHAAGLGGQFTNTSRFDPVDYYAVEEEVEYHPGMEYNND
jgi:hypothetical protein